MEFTLYNKDVVQQLKADAQLATFFFGLYAPYDEDIDAVHNPHWCANTAPKNEALALERAKRALAQAKQWASNYSL